MARFTLPFQLTASMSTFSNLNVPQADQTLSVTPTSNAGATLSSVNVTGTTIDTNEREFLVNVGLTSNHGSGGTAGNDKVALFSGLQAAAGTADVWSTYVSLGLLPGSGNYNAQGIELDLNNNNLDRGTSGNLVTDFGGNIANGLSVTGSGMNTSTTALLLASETPQGGTKPVYARGLSSFGSYTFCPIQDASSAPVGIQFDGSYTIAAINLTSLYGNSGAAGLTALFMQNGQQIAWQNNSRTNAVSDKVDSSNNRYVGIGSAGVFCGASCNPIASGLNLGSSSNYWGQIFSPNGVVNPSDLALKEDVAPLPPASEVIRNVEPIQFRWKNSDDRSLHYGFDASEIKAAFPDDYAGHQTHDGVQHILKDQLISVLWQSNRELLDRIDQLETAVNKLSS